MYYTYIMVMFPKVAAGEEVAAALRLFYFLLTAPVVVVVVEEEEVEAVAEVAAGAPYLDEILLHDDLLAQGKKSYEMFSQSAGMDLHV